MYYRYRRIEVLLKYFQQDVDVFAIGQMRMRLQIQAKLDIFSDKKQITNELSRTRLDHCKLSDLRIRGKFLNSIQ